MQVKCPYCTQIEATVDETGVAFFKSHAIDKHNDATSTPCPASEKNYQVTDEHMSCQDCGQEVNMLRDVDGTLFPEGHNFSWASDKGERVKVAPEPNAGFYSKVWCNSQFPEPVYYGPPLVISDKQPIYA